MSFKFIWHSRPSLIATFLLILPAAEVTYPVPIFYFPDVPQPETCDGLLLVAEGNDYVFSHRPVLHGMFSDFMTSNALSTTVLFCSLN